MPEPTDPPSQPRRPSEESDRDTSVESMVLGRKLREVPPNAKFQQELLRRAGESLFAAQMVLDDAPTAAFVSAYDSIRFAVDVHLNSNGLRAESGDGGHRHRVTYARLKMSDIVSPEDLDYYRAAREIRNRAEYPEPNQPARVNAATAKQAIEVAKRVYAAINSRSKATPRRRARKTAGDRSEHRNG
jgi:hypothetical protein